MIVCPVVRLEGKAHEAKGKKRRRDIKESLSHSVARLTSFPSLSLSHRHERDFPLGLPLVDPTAPIIPV